MDGEVVDPLLALLDEDFPEELPGELLGDASGTLKRLIYGDGSDGDRRVPDDAFPGIGNCGAGAQIHDGVSSPAERPDKLLHLLCRRGAD